MPEQPERLRGTIRRISDRGFGFLTSDGTDFWFHVHDTVYHHEPGAWSAALVGTEVMFDPKPPTGEGKLPVATGVVPVPP
jgi:hypothetical protein